MAWDRDLALIGTGAWGKNLARAFDEVGALGALVDDGPSAEARRELQQRHPAAPFRTFSEVLSDPRIDKVAIATPAASHFELAHAALAAGKHVFVEKPLCLRHEQAKTLIALGERQQRLLMVGHLLQYHPCIARLRELVSGGALGRLLTITSNRLNLGKFRKEENALWSFAPHDVSVILALMDGRLPESVRCVGGAYLSSNVADSTLTIMRFSGNVMAQIHVSWLNPFKEQKLTVVGTDGMAVFDDTKPWPEKLLLYRNYLSWANGIEPTPLSPDPEAVRVPETEPLAAECEHFLQACAGRSSLLTDGAEGARVLSVLDMAQRSLDHDGAAVRSVAPGLEHEPGGFVHPSAQVEEGAEIGAGTRLWQHAHVMRGARVGERCSLGQNVSVASGVVIGNDVKIQNNVSVYDGVVIEDAVFLGPSCVLTNVTNPRAEVSRRALFERTLLRRGATIGANATIVCGVTIGRYAFIGAGAVVTRDVPDYALVLGNPARQHGYVSRHGHRLTTGSDGLMTCPEFGLRYREIEPGVLRCLDLDETAPLPQAMRTGTRRYDELKA
jgi:UDP-2-acetamido-3-amino-2,3-dideoxy-glucuronate N-acetyltransferase